MGMTMLGVKPSGAVTPPATPPIRVGSFIGRDGKATFSPTATPAQGVTAPMSITPMYLSDLNPVDQWTLKDDSGAAINLTNVSSNQLTLKIVNRVTGATTTGAGSFSIITAASGIVQYTWASADTATAGYYLLYVVIAWNGSAPQTLGPCLFDVRALGQV